MPIQAQRNVLTSQVTVTIHKLRLRLIYSDPFFFFKWGWAQRPLKQKKNTFKHAAAIRRSHLLRYYIIYLLVFENREIIFKHVSSSNIELAKELWASSSQG